MASPARASPAQRKANAALLQAQHAESWSKLEKNFVQFKRLPSGPAVRSSPFSPGQAASYISQRIQKSSDNQPKQSQFRDGGIAKGGGASMEWSQIKAPGPEPRIGATLSRIGAGHKARLVLFGGLDKGSVENPQAGAFASSELELFDPHQMRWCTGAERGRVMGKVPMPRVGHAAAPLGRHLLVVFGGRTESGLSSELALLAQYHAKARPPPDPHTARRTLPSPGRMIGRRVRSPLTATLHPQADARAVRAWRSPARRRTRSSSGRAPSSPRSTPTTTPRRALTTRSWPWTSSCCSSVAKCS
jgi:hypothetical protein